MGIALAPYLGFSNDKVRENLQGFNLIRGTSLFLDKILVSLYSTLKESRVLFSSRV